MNRYDPKALASEERDELVERLIEHWTRFRGYWLDNYEASLRAFTYDFTEEQLKHAMDIALSAPRDSYYRYFAGVLNRWKKYGYANFGPEGSAKP